MQVHPDIAALRSDRAPQRQAQTAILGAADAWAEEPGAAQMQADLEAYSKGAPLEACPMLEAMFTGTGEAERLMDLMCKRYCRAIGANPIGPPPFRQGFDGISTSILLARTGRAQLMIQAREPGEMDNPGYVFCDATRFDAVLAGKADARIVRIAENRPDGARFVAEKLALRAGHRLSLDLSSEAVLVDAVQSCFVVLRLLGTAQEPEPGREYDARSGKLLHQSAGRIGTSRREAIIALLGCVGAPMPRLNSLALPWLMVIFRCAGRPSERRWRWIPGRDLAPLLKRPGVGTIHWRGRPVPCARNCLKPIRNLLNWRMINAPRNRLSG